MSKPIRVVFEGEERDAVRAFDNVGDASRKMSQQVARNADDHKLLSARVGESEGRFMGLADVLDGVGTAFGLPIDGAITMARAAGDVTGGLSNLSGIIPSVASKFPMIATGMTFVSAHPLVMGLLAGGAIIGGLILLEKKFGVVSTAVGALGGAFRAAWDSGIKPALNFMLWGVETWINALTAPLRMVSRFVPGIPDLPRVNLPRLDVGGTVLQTGIAVVHRGEVVQPAAGSVGGGGGGTNVTVIVEGSVVTPDDLIDAIHAGLLRKQQRVGNLQIKAA